MSGVLTPVTYIKRVEEQFFTAKKQGLSRMSKEWDSFSQNINKASRALMGACDPKSDQAHCWKLAFSFWVNCSQILSALQTKRPLAYVRMEQMKKQNKQIKRAVFRAWEVL